MYVYMERAESNHNKTLGRSFHSNTEWTFRMAPLNLRMQSTGYMCAHKIRNGKMAILNKIYFTIHRKNWVSKWAVEKWILVSRALSQKAYTPQLFATSQQRMGSCFKVLGCASVCEKGPKILAFVYFFIVLHGHKNSLWRVEWPPSCEWMA